MPAADAAALIAREAQSLQEKLETEITSENKKLEAEIGKLDVSTIDIAKSRVHLL